jgi:glycosyltransferase involved in cell wall biosynthesis
LVQQLSSFKVLMLAPTPFFADRGCHVRIYEEARALQNRGHQVEIVTYHLGRDVAGLRTHRIRDFPWYQKLTAGPSPHKLYLDAFLLALAARRVREFVPDLIHAHLHEGCLIGHLLRLGRKLPLVFDYQGSLADEAMSHGWVREGSFGHRCLGRAEAWINRRADFILVSSGPLAEHLAGRPAGDRVAVIGDGVDGGVFRPGRDPGLRRRLGISGEALLVVFLGLLTPYQGVDLLLESARRAGAEEPRLHFLVMGYPDEARYRERTRELGQSGRVTFTGRVNYFEASSYLAEGDLAVAPKICRTESNGKLLNYLACGLPVVAFDTPVNREILGENAVYAELKPEDEEQSACNLACALLALARDPGRRRRLGMEGRRLAEQEYSWDRSAARIEEIYRQLLEGGRSSDGSARGSG